MRHKRKRPQKPIEVCARCGRTKKQVKGLVRDRYIPRLLSKDVYMTAYMSRVNVVRVCQKCRDEKGDKIVLPNWYKFMSVRQRRPLYMIFHTLKSDIRTYIELHKNEYTEDELAILRNSIGKL